MRIHQNDADSSYQSPCDSSINAMARPKRLTQATPYHFPINSIKKTKENSMINDSSKIAILETQQKKF